jgi:hypothetical protein
MKSVPPTLLKVSADWALWVLTVAPQAGENAVSAWAAAGLAVRVARGRKMRSCDRLFDEFAAALQFPWYFGENWDAFDECLTDLSWLAPGAGYVLVITDPAEVLASSDEDLTILVRLFTAAHSQWATPIATGEAWDRPAVPFHVVLQTLSLEEPRVIERWERAGAGLSSFHE